MILIKLVYSEIGPEIKKARVLFTSHYTNLEVSLHCSVRTLPVTCLLVDLFFEVSFLVLSAGLFFVCEEQMPV